jgi:hypothetical protein
VIQLHPRELYSEVHPDRDVRPRRYGTRSTIQSPPACSLTQHLWHFRNETRWGCFLVCDLCVSAPTHRHRSESFAQWHKQGMTRGVQSNICLLLVVRKTWKAGMVYAAHDTKTERHHFQKPPSNGSGTVSSPPELSNQVAHAMDAL